MKRLAAVLVATVAVVGSGCAPSAFVVRGASRTGAADLSRCATRQLERLGYTVRDADALAGVVRATMNTSTIRMVLHSGKDSEDRIVVTTASDAAGGTSTMLVAGTSLFWGTGTGKIAGPPSAGLAGAVHQILEACGILDAARVESR